MKTTERTNWHIRAYEQLSGHKLTEVKRSFIKPMLLDGGCVLYRLPNRNDRAKN